MSAAPQNQTFEPPPPPPPPPTSTQEAPLAPRPTKLRPFAIGLFGLGILVVIGGVTKLVAGGIGTGGALCFFGVVLFGLSFIRLPSVPDTEPPLSWFEKATGIFYEPTRVFRNLRVHPHWVGAFLTIWVLAAIYSTAFVQRITPERIVDHTVEKISQMGPPFAPPPEAIEAIRTNQLEALKNPVQRAGTIVKSAVAIFFLGAVLPATIAFLGMIAFGGRINFWQSLAVILYGALPIVVIQKLLGLAILYLKSPDDLHPILNQETTLQDNLGILFTPADHPVLFVIASVIGITSFYGLWLRARGLHLGATRAGSGQAWGVAITQWILFLLFSVILTALFPGFIS